MKLLISLSNPYLTSYRTLKTVLPHIIETKLEYGIVSPESLRVELLDHGIKGDEAEQMVAKLMEIIRRDPQLVS